MSVTHERRDRKMDGVDTISGLREGIPEIKLQHAQVTLNGPCEKIRSDGFCPVR